MPLRKCIRNKWTQPKSRCLGFCPEVHNILIGKVSHLTPRVAKAALEFRCANNSFQLIGKTRLECIDGRWNGRLPYCQKLPSCVRLQSPSNGTLHGNDNSHSAEAKFTCFTGFDLFGASTLTCNKGVWSSRVPTCKAVSSYFGSNESCSDELGMQSKRIANERITASSSRSTDNSPHFARLDGSKAWCSVLRDNLPYIQIQLEEPKIITNIITQGSSSDRAWVTKYEVRFRENGKWKEYDEELTGNNNVHGLRSNILDPPIRTQLIRIYPKNPMTLDDTDPKPYCLRLELYGCSAPGSSCQPPISPYGSTIAQQGNHKNGSTVVFGCKQGLYLTGLPVIKCNGNTWTAVNFKCLLKCNEALDIHRRSIVFIHETLNTISIEVRLRKGNVITAASVHLEDIRSEDQQIQIRARISNRLVQINHFKPRVGEEEEKLKLSRPVITQSLQIWLIFRKGYKFSLSRTPRVFGCKSAVFRGCIMSGSAVLFREGKSYLKGRFVSIARHSLWEVLYRDKYFYKSKDKVLLDEKPNLDEIPEGTAVVGEDQRGNLREGKIKRVCSSIQCTIETDGEEWQSKLENVRVFRKELCENHMMT